MKLNNGWKVIISLAAALAATATGAQADQIDLSGNYVSSAGIINLSSDLTSGTNPLIENVESNVDFKQVLLFNSEFSNSHLFDAETSSAGGAAPYTISLAGC